MNNLINGWKSIKLKELCREITVGFVGPMATEYVESGIPFLRSQNILPFRLELSSIKFISPEFHKKLKKSALHPGDVVVVRTGYPGTACVIPSKLPVSNCADLVIFRPSSQLDPYYLTLKFNSTLGRSHVAGNLVGVAQQHFNVSVAKEMIVNIPPLTTQRKIASILSAYDDLIENNTRRIAILEEMAQSLYRDWFVHFRFPGHEKKRLVESELGLIPEGWEVKTIEETIEILGGGTPSTSNSEYWNGGDVNWFSPSDLTSAGTMFISNSSKKITTLGLQKSSARMFPAYSVMMTSRATIGVVAINTKPACTNQGFITCIPNQRLSAYQIYYWLGENKEKINTLASGATFKEINKTTFRKLPIVIADKSTSKQFNEMLLPIGKQIENLIARNAILHQTRDLLLPKLLSGVVDVEELDIQVCSPVF